MSPSSLSDRAEAIDAPTRPRVRREPRKRSRWSRLRRHFGRRVRPAYIALGTVGLLLLVGALRISAAYKDLRAAEDAFLDARIAVAETRTDDAAQQLDEAERRLERAKDVAGSMPLALTRPIPLLGSPAKAVDDIAAAGHELVAAGRLINDAAADLPTAGQVGIDGHDLSAFHEAGLRARSAMQQASRHLERAAAAVEAPAGALLPQVSNPARSALATMRDALEQLDGVQRGLAVLTDLSAPGAKARILVLSQDTLELRPTGGFVGSYGILDFDDGRVELSEFRATEELPPLPAPLEAPPQFDAAQWGLENALWWPDFPTSAETAAQLYAAQGGGDVDGVLAVTETVMARLVGVFGPIAVPGYREPIAEEGFEERILYEVELKRPLDSPRKLFLARLAHEVVARVFALQPDETPEIASVLSESVGRRDVQLWFADARRQALIEDLAIAGSLPEVTGDFLMLVDSNQTASKANRGLVRDVTYSVQRDAERGLMGRVDIRYRNEARADVTNPYYNGYLRLYVPAGAVPVEATAADAGRAPDGNYQVLERSVYVAPGGEALVSVRYELPDRISAGDYELTWIRQAGTTSDELTATINGRSAGMAPDAPLVIEADLSENGLVRFLRSRWIGRFLD